MAVVKCGSVDCKYNSDNGICEKSNISLSDCYYHTLNEGFQHFWRCRNYEQSDEAKSLEEEFNNMFDRKE